MKLMIILGLILYSNITYANQNCPNLNGKYQINETNSTIIDMLNLLKINKANMKDSELEIRGDTDKQIELIFTKDSNNSLDKNIRVSEIFKKNQDYKCKNDEILFNFKNPATRNNAPGFYSGQSQINLSIDDLFNGLKIETTFKGYEDITLFSYDSANISFPKFWGKK